MSSLKIFLLIASGLIIVASSGCTTKTTTENIVSRSIDSDSIQEFIDNPSGAPLTFEKGDTISFHTKETIIVSSRKVNWVKMVVKDVNTVRIRGEVVDVIEDEGERNEKEKEGVKGNIIEVKLQDMESIWVWGLRTKKEFDDTLLNIIGIFIPIFLFF
jgi:hypothetical protein